MAEKPTPPSNGGSPMKPFFIVALLGIAIALSIMLWNNKNTAEKEWSKFLDDLKTGKVVNVKMHIDNVEVEYENTSGTQNKFFVKYPGSSVSDEAQRQIKEANDFPRPPGVRQANLKGGDGHSMMAALLPQLLLLALLIFLFYFFFLRRMGQGGGIMSFGKSRATLITKGKTGKTFKDVAGIDEAREEVEELVSFLRDPKKFQKLGGRIPRGVLLVGPPGAGKTLLAKAIAGEADVPFYSISGSDFVEMFVGVGASRVRDLFQQAKDTSPCIIFIDEIDAVARKRSNAAFGGGGHDEREQTLNAILVEMDGFSSNDKVIVLAATNRPDVLDPALRRPGRFDRHIYVNLPDILGREQILKVHSQKVKLGIDVDLQIVARGTPGFSGADLENLINEAALHAARENKESVNQADFEFARDRISFGRERKVGSYAMPAEERKITAYHEAGHTIIMAHLKDQCEDLHKVSIIPRGRALGATMSLHKDRYTYSRTKLLADICALYGGRIAESVFCADITSGASNDIQRATEVARAMIYELGMSERMGPVRYSESETQEFGPDSKSIISEDTRRQLDGEVRRIMDEQYRRAETIVAENRAATERLALALLDRETLSAEEIFLVIEGKDLPPLTHRIENPTAKKPETPEVKA